MKFSRQIRYLYLRVIRLRGEPRDLALGIAFGVFTGMMPIMPFQTALAVTLAVLFKASKIAAALGTWVSNPFNWYFLYFSNYKLGALILGLSEKNRLFFSVMESIRQGEEATAVVAKIAGAGSAMIGAFLLGGFVMGSASATISYPLFLRLFQAIRNWRTRRSHRKHWQQPNL